MNIKYPHLHIFPVIGSIVISSVIAAFCYLFFLQTQLVTRRELAFAALLWLALTPLIYLLLSRFLFPRLKTYSPKARRNWILLSVGVGILFGLVTRPTPIISAIAGSSTCRFPFQRAAWTAWSRLNMRRPRCGISASGNSSRRGIGREPKQAFPTPAPKPPHLPGPAAPGIQPRLYLPTLPGLQGLNGLGWGPRRGGSSQFAFRTDHFRPQNLPLAG